MGDSRTLGSQVLQIMLAVNTHISLRGRVLQEVGTLK